MDAQKLEFPDETFDLVYGGAIFHHLDCKAAFSEARRVLKKDGTFLITEPLGMNPVAKLIRWLTPAARTPDEKPFDSVEINMLRNLFKIEHFETYDLLFVPAAVASGFFFQSPSNPLTKAGDAIDRGIFAAIPPARYWARQALFACRKQ
jgi:SAM-dependent methyltransferase